MAHRRETRLDKALFDRFELIIDRHRDMPGLGMYRVGGAAEMHLCTIGERKPSSPISQLGTRIDTHETEAIDKKVDLGVEQVGVHGKVHVVQAHAVTLPSERWWCRHLRSSGSRHV